MAVLSKGNLFEPELVTDLINKVRGKSSLAVLSGQTPIPFNGQKEFTFTMDSEVDIVAENGKKSHGGITVAPITIVPVKFEYGARVSDEFMYASEEEQIETLKAFNEGFSRKLARGLDIAGFHGYNPRTGLASAVVGDNHFDAKVTQTVTYTAASADNNVDSAIDIIADLEGDVSGMAMSTTFRSALANLKNSSNERLYPELAWGNTPKTLNGLAVSANPTVSFGESKDMAIIGDFENMFRWGYAKEIPLQIIEYGDPDNSGQDLKGYNQVYIRAEVYLGWGILDPTSFTRIVEE